MLRRRLLLASGAALAAAPALAQVPTSQLPGIGAEPRLPPPVDTKGVERRSRTIGWRDGQMPKAPQGFRVTRFGTGLESPRNMLVLPNGDVLVAEAATRRAQSPNRVTLLRDRDGDGVAEERHVLLQGLSQPFGLALMGGNLIVGNTDGLVAFAFEPGQTRIEGRGRPLLELPAGGYNNHWTRNLLPSRDGSKLLVSVGSASNVGEHGLEREHRRACILEVNPDGTGERFFATGLRNPVGMDFEPTSGALWTAVNERDDIGDDLVPDYITSVREGAFYGWPYAYWGRNVDPRLAGQAPEMVARSVTPDYALGAHTASLGLAFHKVRAGVPDRYHGGVFVGQRGSWNRREFVGYAVVFVPFRDGRPAGPPEEFLTGFMANPQTGEAHGRPVGVAVDARGGILVADDEGDAVWRVAAA